MTNRTIAKYGMKNHLILASGPLSKTKAQLLEYGAVAGAIIGKSLDRQPRKGNPAPRVARVDPIGMLNYEDGANPGLEVFCRELEEARAEGLTCPVFGSLSLRACRKMEDAIYMARRLADSGVCGLELDLKYVYDTRKGRIDFGPQEIGDIVASLRNAVEIPLIAKIAYSSFDMRELARVAESHGAEGISAINTIFPAMRINLERRKSVLSVEYGGLSGPAIRPLAVATVHQLFKVVKIPIMGVGGVATGEDVVEMMMAGAETVQILTVAMLEGPKAFERIQAEAEEVVTTLGFSRLDECIGAAHLQP